MPCKRIIAKCAFPENAGLDSRWTCPVCGVEWRRILTTRGLAWSREPKTDKLVCRDAH